MYNIIELFTTNVFFDTLNKMNKCVDINKILYNANVLEFGCGTGKKGEITKKFSLKHFTGVDILKDRIKYANKRNNPKTSFYSIDPIVDEDTKIDFTDNSFDFIIINCVLHHIKSEHMKHILNELYRVLKMGGYIFINEPVNKSITSTSTMFMNYFDDGDYIRYEKEYLSYLKNFNIICKDYARGYFYEYFVILGKKEKLKETFTNKYDTLEISPIRKKMLNLRKTLKMTLMIVIALSICVYFINIKN